MGPHAGRRADAVIAIGTILAVSCRRLVSFEILPNFFKWLASFSFSLYAIHIPVVFVTLAVFQNVGCQLINFPQDQLLLPNLPSV
jgi:peptidoglycan/LPS O-acetylase OafA/YrhL